MIEKHHEEAKKKGLESFLLAGMILFLQILVVFAAKAFEKNQKHSLFPHLEGEASGGTIETMFSAKSSGETGLP